MDIRATTKSGTTYTFRDNLLRIQPADRRAAPTTINIITMKSFKTDEGAHLTLSNLMEFLHDKPEIDRPVVGEHLFVAGFDNWRISTPIETVEEL